MLGFIKRVAAPVVRLTTMEKVDYRPTFETFGGHLTRVVIEERARQEPRIVSLQARRACR